MSPRCGAVARTESAGGSVTRPAVVVREADPADVPALLQMWAELRDIGGRLERLIPDPDQDAMGERLESVRRDPGSRAMVAVVDTEVAGMVLLTAGPYAPL